MCPDCSPPSDPPQLVEYVAVAHRGRRYLDARRLHRRVEAVIRHHGNGDAAAAEASLVTEVQSRQRDELVAVDDHALAVDGEDAIAVAVECERDVVVPFRRPLRELLDVGGSAFVVDVAAVGLGREDIDVRSQAPEYLRGGAIGRAVGAVEQEPAVPDL